MHTPANSDASKSIAAKSVVRQAALDTREAAFGMLGAQTGGLIAERFMAAVPITEEAVVAGYFPIRSEADCVPLMSRLSNEGHVCALPRVVAVDAPLEFGVWLPGAETGDGPFGTRIPPEAAPVIEPNMLLVPLLAFDRDGYRLGYGGGFYDRTLQALRRRKPVTAIGIAFAAQECPTLPRDGLDEPLDWVVTEQEARCFSGVAA